MEVSAVSLEIGTGGAQVAAANRASDPTNNAADVAKIATNPASIPGNTREVSQVAIASKSIDGPGNILDMRM
ncbi:MAG TPA: hypothetical protein P5096_01410 [Patescibacteria group bacterium]|nr:hypothetical protein [Patescibacteria group bacterium]